jgi:hypothetical protein
VAVEDLQAHLRVLATSPASPAQGRVYFDSSENTIKVYNGNIWYDVAGPKELLDHQHYAGEGLVRHVDYGQYVDELNYIVSMDGGTASTSYASAPNNDIIDGEQHRIWQLEFSYAETPQQIGLHQIQYCEQVS